MKATLPAGNHVGRKGLFWSYTTTAFELETAIRSCVHIVEDMCYSLRSYHHLSCWKKPPLQKKFCNSKSGESTWRLLNPNPSSIKVDLVHNFIHLEVERLVRLECDLLPSPEKKTLLSLIKFRKFRGAELIQDLYKTRRRYDAIPYRMRKRNHPSMSCEVTLEVGSEIWTIVLLPSRKLTYPTWGKGKSSSKCLIRGIC